MALLSAFNLEFVLELAFKRTRLHYLYILARLRCRQDEEESLSSLEWKVNSCVGNFSRRRCRSTHLASLKSRQIMSIITHWTRKQKSMPRCAVESEIIVEQKSLWTIWHRNLFSILFFIFLPHSEMCVTWLRLLISSSCCFLDLYDLRQKWNKSRIEHWEIDSLETLMTSVKERIKLEMP